MKMTIKIAVEMITELQNRIESLESAQNRPQPQVVTRDRGPKSTRKMTEDDARRMVFGDLESVSHKDVAIELGLSYAQVFSCRGGYTFKNLQNEKLVLKKAE
jgi:hypothetical protein